MKRVLLVSLVIFVLSFGTAFAEDSFFSDITADISVAYVSEPVSGFDTTTGFGIGASKDFLKVFKKSKRTVHTERLKLRVDLNYYKWEQSVDFVVGSVDLEVVRIPLFLGGRYTFPKKLGDKISIYGEGGLEISFDTFEAGACLGFPPFVTCTTESTDEMNFGISPGVGLIYPFNEKVSAGLDLRYHLISDSYWNAALSLSYLFK